LVVRNKVVVKGSVVKTAASAGWGRLGRAWMRYGSVPGRNSIVFDVVVERWTERMGSTVRGCCEKDGVGCVQLMDFDDLEPT
jgi:hypothetical protein